MNILQMIRNGLLGFSSKRSNNNRKLTPGRVAAGKSTYKGCELEHQHVKLEKRIDEIARMLFAVDIKLNNHPDDRQRMDLLDERHELSNQLDGLIEIYEDEVSGKRFGEVMDELDQEERHRRKVRGLSMP